MIPAPRTPGSAGTPSDGYKTADDQGHEYAPRRGISPQ